MKKYFFNNFHPSKPKTLWGRVMIFSYIVIKLTLIALMTNSTPGAFIYSGF
jgi:hypothetical protein